MPDRRNGGDTSNTVETVFNQIMDSSDAATKVGLDLCDAADRAAEQMVAECQRLEKAVKDGTDRMRNELRIQMVEYGSVMRDYAEAIAAKNAAFIEAGEQAKQTMRVNIDAVRKALAAVAPSESEPLELPRLLLGGSTEKA